MSFQTISLAEIADGAPIDTALMAKIKNDLDDLDHRLDLVEAGTPGPVNGGGESTPPGGSAYRYYKLKFMEGYNSIGNPVLSSTVSVTELRFKYDNLEQSLAGMTISANAGSIVPLTDGLMPVNNTGFWNVPIASNPEIIVDLGTSKTVTDILMAPQGSDPDQVYNSPKKFEVLGSADGVAYTSIKIFDLAAPVLGTAAGQWKAGNLTSFSIAASATPVVVLTRNYTQNTDPDFANQFFYGANNGVFGTIAGFCGALLGSTYHFYTPNAAKLNQTKTYKIRLTFATNVTPTTTTKVSVNGGSTVTISSTNIANGYVDIAGWAASSTNLIIYTGSTDNVTNELFYATKMELFEI
jgi:hypothetical protein